MVPGTELRPGPLHQAGHYVAGGVGQQSGPLHHQDLHPGPRLSVSSGRPQFRGSRGEGDAARHELRQVGER